MKCRGKKKERDMVGWERRKNEREEEEKGEKCEDEENDGTIPVKDHSLQQVPARVCFFLLMLLLFRCERWWLIQGPNSVFSSVAGGLRVRKTLPSGGSRYKYGSLTANTQLLLPGVRY